MISYIVASGEPDVLAANLGATLQLVGRDELIVIDDPSSIAIAYNEGQSKASNTVCCYVHSDVQVNEPVALRRAILTAAIPDVGMVGLVGSRTRSVPWWDGDKLGSVVDARMGTLDFGPGGRCAYLDGLLLATSQHVQWDESFPGFHLYDHDICRQMLARGLDNHCLDAGSRMVTHNTRNPADVRQLDGWDIGVARFRKKWSIE